MIQGLTEMNARAIIRTKELGTYLLRVDDEDTIKLSYRCYYNVCHRTVFKDPSDSGLFALRENGPFTSMKEIVEDLELGPIIKPGEEND